MHFENPEYLYFLLLLPVFFLLFAYRLITSRRRLSRYMHPACLKSAAGDLFFRRRMIKHSILCGMFLFLVLALARPRGALIKQNITVHGAEVMILADVSKSMLVSDMGGSSRLIVMKKELKSLIHKLSGQRVGLIAFAGSAVLLSPLTLDHSVLLLQIEALSAHTLPVQGTDFGSAFRMAGLALKRGGVLDKQHSSSRVIVAATDGEDNEAQAQAAAQKLSKEGVRVFLMGFGSKRGGAIPVLDRKGRKTGYKKDSAGRLILSRLNAPFLKKMALTGKGAFYHVSAGDNSVSALYSNIQSLGKGQKSGHSQNVYQQLYAPFVLLSLLCGGLYLLIGDRPHALGDWRRYLKV